MMDNCELRKHLHSLPELSGREKNTSKIIVSFLEQYHPDDLITGIGGFGIAATFNGDRPAPKVLVRCELDALPIPETLEMDYHSEAANVSHKCGHDGHMAIVAGLAGRLREQSKGRGPVVLMFQPAEETGEGAQKVLDDPAFDRVKPDYVLALHNLPGFPLGQVIIREGTFASASSGLRIRLTGKTSHAAEPEAGNSPALAVAQLIQVLSAIPQFHTSLHQPAQVTVIHANVGEVAFGTSPGQGDVMVTVRAHTREVLDLLLEKATSYARHTAAMYGLDVSIDPTELFPPTDNDPEVVNLIKDAADEAGLGVNHRSIPFAWSEDFGHFTARYKGALFGLGSGERHPALHHPDYDFPDDLLEPGMTMFMKVIQKLQDV